MTARILTLRANKAAPTQERVKEVLHYDPETGDFTWLKNKCKRIRRGDPAGWITNRGYVRVRVDHIARYAHRLAFLYQTGTWPSNDIDHIDCNPSNNAWVNLREATKVQNQANIGVRRGNRLGVKGVRKQLNRYRATIRVYGKTVHLGSFLTPEEAHAAYMAEATKLYGEFARSAS